MLTALLRAFRAEVVRTRRTAGLLVSLAGLAICLVQALGWWAVATQELRGWSQLLAWQTAYVTGMAAPLVALIGGLAVRREQAARSGGTPWRAIGRGPVQVARIAVLAGQVLIFNLSIIVPMSFVGLAAGLGEPPLMRLLGLALVTWLGTLPILVLSVALSERIGLYLTLGLSLVWQVVGTMQAEATTWWLQPWTWAVRPSLPILQIRANGTASAPDDAVRDFSVGQPLLLAVAFAVVLLFVVALLPEPREHSRRLFRRRCRGAGRSVDAETRDPGRDLPAAETRRNRPTVVRAAWTSLRHTPIPWAVPMLLAALIVVELIWDPAYVRGLFGLILVPLAACTAACLMAAAQAPALRLILLRSSATQWCLALGSVLIVSWLPVAVGAGLLSGAQGPSIAVVGMSVGVGLAGLNLWLATAFGPAPTIGVTVAGLTLSLIFGASALAARLWMLGPWAWAYSSITPDRMIFAVTVSLGCAAVTFVLWTRAVRRVARQ